MAAFATSYIPTQASQVTRAADNASMLGDNFATWFNATEGTIYIDATAQSPAFSAFFGGTSGNEFYVRQASSGPSFAVVVGGVTQANFGSSSLIAKIANAYKTNNFASCVNGGAVATDTSGNIPVVSALGIGSTLTGSVSINGHIRSISYYPTRLPNATLQSITS